jgi:lysozyme
MSARLDEAREVATETLIKPSEGLARVGADGLVYPYICAAGYPTQGWGIVVPTMQVPAITKEMADAILAREVPKYMMDALRASPVLAAYPMRLAAITSFVFNLGAARYRASTLRRRIDAREWELAGPELLRWNRGGGRVLRGLDRRRRAELAVFERG